jgi:hypothetical protein
VVLLCEQKSRTEEPTSIGRGDCETLEERLLQTVGGACVWRCSNAIGRPGVSHPILEVGGVAQSKSWHCTWATAVLNIQHPLTRPRLRPALLG